jgi:outer membrane protein OmpA-like peptidoglycan-associated protein
MDLFTYAAHKQAEAQPPPPPEPEPVPPSQAVEPDSPSEPYSYPVQQAPSAPLFHRSIESGKPLTGVLDPLTRVRVPLWADRDRKRKIAMKVVASIVVGVFVVLAIIAISSGRKKSPSQGATTKPPASPDPTPRAERPAAPPPPRAQTPAATPAPVQSSRSADGLSLKVPGATVKAQGDVRIVTFDSGIFMGGVRLSSAARRSLDALGRQLAPYGKRLSITVIGCTDNVPINMGGRYENNQDLGLARANEVAQHLQRSAKIPASVFQTLSYGERWTPYPNDTPENRARNRTAVLRISVR